MIIKNTLIYYHLAYLINLILNNLNHFNQICLNIQDQDLESFIFQNYHFNLDSINGY